MARFERDYAGGDAYQSALTDYAEGTAWFGVSAIPAVIFMRTALTLGVSAAGATQAAGIESAAAETPADPGRSKRRRITWDFSTIFSVGSPDRRWVDARSSRCGRMPGVAA